MSVLPLRIVNLTAATLDMVGVFAAIYADVLANSTWTIPESDSTVPPGAPGAFALTLRSPSGALELSLINAGASQSSPSAALARLGINPDGSADPITDAKNPQASAANFSGVDNGWTLSQTIANAEFILVEWSDALMVLFKNAQRTAFTNGWHWGKCLQQPITALENSGDLRLDGHIIFGNLPAVQGGSAWVSSNASVGSAMRRRITTGNSIDAALAGITGAWAQPATSQSMTSAPIPINDASYIYGSDERIVVPAEYHALNSNSGDKGWLSKYLRLTSPILPPLSLWRVSGTDQYMVLGMSTADSPLCIPILAGFDPIP